jgi:hypothetical protein
MRFAGLPLGTEGALAAYAGMIDGLVADVAPEENARVPVQVTDTLMADAAARRRVAETTLQFATSLRPSGLGPRE